MFVNAKNKGVLMIINRISQIKSDNLFYRLENYTNDLDVYLKLDGLNIAGSIKLKTAISFVNHLELQGKIKSNLSTLICSSSGNLGVALSIICKEKGYKLICVSDPNILSENARLIKLYGAELVTIKHKDKNGGYLGARIDWIKAKINENRNYIWVDQYSNVENIRAHYMTTAKEIHKQFEHVDYLFVGAGTTGTLMGCGKYFKNHSPETKIIAVDAIGSVTFNRDSEPRFIPGIGTSRRPGILDEKYIDEVSFVDELDCIHSCRNLLNRYGLFVGGSTGSVLHAIRQTTFRGRPKTIVAVSPDFGNKYTETIYSDDWVFEKLNKMLEEPYV